MQNARTIVKTLVLALAAALAGCSSTTPEPTLSASSITGSDTVGGLTAPNGTYFATVNVTLSNPTSGVASAWYYYFTGITTPSGLALSPPSDVNAVVDTPCSFDVSLAPEANGVVPHYACNLVFDVPCAETPFAVAYDPSGAEADVPKLTPPTCSTGSTPGTGGGDAGQ
jgi:hypothetical protein